MKDVKRTEAVIGLTFAFLVVLGSITLFGDMGYYVIWSYVGLVFLSGFLSYAVAFRLTGDIVRSVYAFLASLVAVISVSVFYGRMILAEPFYIDFVAFVTSAVLLGAVITGGLGAYLFSRWRM